MKYLVSACLAGEACRYDGKANTDSRIRTLVMNGQALPVCPEVLGGLTVPRDPCEIREGRVMSKTGKDCTAAFDLGAQQAFEQGEAAGCCVALLKARSPSCGVGRIYDGTFNRTLVEGDGVFAAMVRSKGMPLYSEETWPGEEDL